MLNNSPRERAVSIRILPGSAGETAPGPEVALSAAPAEHVAPPGDPKNIGPSPKSAPAGPGDWRPLCLIPACRYTQAGLQALGPVDVLDGPSGLLSLFPMNYRVVVCDLGGELAGVLSRVALLTRLLQSGAPVPSAVVFLTHRPPPWLFGTLLYVAGSTRYLPDLRVVDDRAPLSALVPLVNGELPSRLPRLPPCAAPALATGLSPRELFVTAAVLAGETTRSLSARTGVSLSALHYQRQAGLRKLGLRRKPGERPGDAPPQNVRRADTPREDAGA